MFNIFLSQSCVFNKCQVQFMFFTSTKYSCQATDFKSDSQARMRNSRGGPLKMVISMKAFFRTKIFGLLFFSFFFFPKLMLCVFGGYFFCSLILHSTVTKNVSYIVVI